MTTKTIEEISMLIDDFSNTLNNKEQNVEALLTENLEVLMQKT